MEFLLITDLMDN